MQGKRQHDRRDDAPRMVGGELQRSGAAVESSEARARVRQADAAATLAVKTAAVVLHFDAQLIRLFLRADEQRTAFGQRRQAVLQRVFDQRAKYQRGYFSVEQRLGRLDREIEPLAH